MVLHALEVHMASEYHRFKSLIKKMIGIDLNLYKEAQMKRRIISLKNRRGFDNFPEYYEALRCDEHLLKEFIDRLTINVSEFFRNPKRWDVLKNKVFPHLLENKNNLTIWSAACSTGEEPYSIAMILQEFFPQAEYRILATDIDEKVLLMAKKGIYQQQALKEVPSVLQNKYFKEQRNLFYIDHSLKQSIFFKHHNLLADAYPKNIDLIVCRNVLIYFTDEAKDIIYQNFSQTLSDQGVLFVGSTEQIFSPQNYDLTIFDTFFYKKDRELQCSLSENDK